MRKSQRPSVSNTLDDKIKQAKLFIRLMAEKHENPIIMSSYGKDSMVMMHLIRNEGFKFPILFFKEPFNPEKYAFANLVIAHNGDVVYDYPPGLTTFAEANGHCEVMNHHQAGATSLRIGTGIREPEEGEPWLCALRDLYDKPTVDAYNFPWDLAFVGHKDSDVDPLLGPVPLPEYYVRLNDESPGIAFPLKNFTDEDIWNYAQQTDLDINLGRYDQLNGYKEKEDIRFNSDYFYACTACMREESRGKRVFCPLVREEIDSNADAINRENHLRPGYLRTVAEREEIDRIIAELDGELGDPKAN